MVISFENLFKTRLSIQELVFLLKLYLCQVWCGHDEEYPNLETYDNEIDSVGVLLEDEKSQYFYCNLPIGYRWSGKKKRSNDDDRLECPYHRDHMIYRRLKRLNDIIMERKSMDVRRLQLSKLLMIFLKKMIQSSTCSFCKKREMDLSILKGHFLQYNVDIGVGPWYFKYHIPPSMHDVVCHNLEIHLRHLDSIYKQIRNDQIKIWLSKQIYVIFSGLVPEATHMLLHEKNHPEIFPFQHYGKKFQKEVFEQVRPELQFLSFKSIRFDEWFESLFRFHVLCEMVVPPSDNYAVLYQLLLVIHDFEAVIEKKSEGKMITEIIYCNKDDNVIEYVLEDADTKRLFLKECYRYHPFLRGEPLISFVKN